MSYLGVRKLKLWQILNREVVKLIKLITKGQLSRTSSFGLELAFYRFDDGEIVYFS
jgi:hypothetical protein